MKDKNYSVREVAEITGFTTRTIRNYIKNGKLSGTKFGSHWRFTDEDIAKLGQVFNMRCKFQKAQFDFLNRLNNCEFSSPHSCYVCCYPSNKIKDINELRKEIAESLKNNKKFKADFFYHYNYVKRQIEFALIGSNEEVKLMNEIIMKYISDK